MTTATQIRVIFVDDHSIMRDGLQEVLESSGEFEVVGQAKDGGEAVNVARSVMPEVIIMDLIMPQKNGIDACREILDVVPDTRVLFLTASTDLDAAIEAVAAGATGYLQMYSGKEKLLATIRDVIDGEFRIPAEVARKAFPGFRSTAGTADSPELDRLTAREQEILRLFAKGLSYAEIAEARGNRPLTIRNAIYGIRDKLEAKTKQEMVVWAVRRGLLYNGS